MDDTPTENGCRPLSVEAPAKLNLALAVGPRRDDGYHPLATLFQTISLCDRLLVEPAGALGLRVTGPEAAGVPPGEANLVWRAARLFFERFGRPGLPQPQVTVEKRIPAGAGLAGGSSDAAALLRALARWHGGVSRRELAALAAELGSDVPFLLDGGTALGFGRGERLEPVPPLPEMAVVVAKPPASLSTADVYRAFDELRPQAADPAARPEWRAVEAAARAGEPERLWPACFNDLETPAARLCPEIRPLLEALAAAPSRRASGMTGSGTAVWAVMADGAEAEALAAALRGRGYWTWCGRLRARVGEPAPARGTAHARAGGAAPAPGAARGAATAPDTEGCA
ncbi:MAG: 4-(cytidine 5'-diphospho)-2-C-methyl-D-erythritol kinase [Firmicutes bacterium]|nr:4-(cytidine 5'-diphospho)-2-C-methyl-D-erythritol kinase [Bacillota bacterium]